jgi:hypothetical protein
MEYFNEMTIEELHKLFDKRHIRFKHIYHLPHVGWYCFYSEQEYENWMKNR